jgi:lysozyme
MSKKIVVIAVMLIGVLYWFYAKQDSVSKNDVGEQIKTNQVDKKIKKQATQNEPVAPSKKESLVVKGIDVSHFQGDINWEEIKSAGINFSYSKATQGHGFKDPKFQMNWKNAQAVGLAAGAYHFYMVGSEAEPQVKIFLEAVGKLNPGDMPPMIDLEQGSIPKGVKVDVVTFQKNVITWLNEVERELGVQPIIYTNNPFANAYLKDSTFSKYKLWLAEYGVDTPRVPATWSNKGWTIWQRSERGKIEGAIGDIDHDLLNTKLFSLEELQVD